MSDYSDMIDQIAKRITKEAEDYAYKNGGTLEDALRKISINVNGRTLPAPVSPNSTSEGHI